MDGVRGTVDTKELTRFLTTLNDEQRKELRKETQQVIRFLRDAIRAEYQGRRLGVVTGRTWKSIRDKITLTRGGTFKAEVRSKWHVLRFYERGFQHRFDRRRGRGTHPARYGRQVRGLFVFDEMVDRHREKILDDIRGVLSRAIGQARRKAA